METLDRITFMGRLNSIKMCLSAHPDNLPNSEFEDRINDCEKMISFISDDSNFN